MTINNAIFAIAGFLIMLSLALGASVSPILQNENWLWLGAFVGFNLFQSAFTGFCPAAIVFKKLGLK